MNKLLGVMGKLIYNNKHILPVLHWRVCIIKISKSNHWHWKYYCLTTSSMLNDLCALAVWTSDVYY